MKKNEDRIAIYSRKSKFTGKGESIGNQIELCKEYIRAHYDEKALNTVIIYEDEGFSGGNLNRPDFKKMMAAAKERKFNAIIVYRLDRISRNISDFSNLIEELCHFGIAFISIKEQFDTSTPMGRAMMYIASVFSQLERETIAERIRDNMHELAKTGRWLGGTTPTGYASESVNRVTVDGKIKKVCKLKLIPAEAEIVKTIYDLFIETNSLTSTESELMNRQIVTKNGKYFTRFSIKAILQNPVYLIADNAAYSYFTQKNADLFSDYSAFDGQHGILAYNRTDQNKGKSTVYLPISEWIVSVGQHPGLIPGKIWVSVQESLEHNKSKTFRRPRSSDALLTGLLYCRCGNKMYPKLSKRKTVDGDLIYTYVCKMKERSKRSLCNVRNANGNTLDAAIIDQIKTLEDDKNTFIDQLGQNRRFYTKNRTQYEEKLTELKQEKTETKKRIDALVDSLAELDDSSAKEHVIRRMEQLHLEYEGLDARIKELIGLTSQHALSNMEFTILSQLLSVFKASIDNMTIEQKRTAIRTVIRKVIWDGQNTHVILFGALEDDMEYPDISNLYSKKINELEPFPDIDYEENNSFNNSKPFLCEDSK
ncbi:MAG: recombinase family protein [Eubacteriales bacterium]|nr:recombinase family protein [Eubacteriales bacterium]